MNDSTEWDTNRLDLDAYLTRVGTAGELAVTEATLYRLHRAHVAAIPFENLDIPLGRGISTELDDVQSKLVTRGRGGYCYEHALLFGAACERLGYTVTRLLARIGDEQVRPRARTHMALHVGGANGEWLADVGFGAGLLEPLPWGDTGAHGQGGWIYQLLPRNSREWQVAERRGSEWTVLYSFADEPQHASDVTMANHFTATYPSSPFVGQPVVMRKHDDVQLRLRGRELSYVHPDGSMNQHELTDDEFAAALYDEFSLNLSEAEITTLVASLPPRTGTGR